MSTRSAAQRLTSVARLLGLAGLVAGCEPSTISEARDQLARGGERLFTWTAPITVDTFKVETLLDDPAIVLDTTAGGLLAVKIDPESVTVSVGDSLRFEDITFDQFVQSFTDAEVQVPQGTPIPFSATYTALASDTVLDAVDTVVVNNGTLSLTTQNRLPVSMAYTLTLNGFIDTGGTPLTASDTVGPAPGDGSYVSDVINFNLAGVAVAPQSVQAVVTGTATAGVTLIPSGLGTNAVIQDGDIANIVVERLVGPLDPAQTPELSIAVEEFDSIPRANVDFGDLEDAIKDASINSATIQLTVDNSANAPAVLRNFTLGVVELDATGNIPRDMSGNPVYQPVGSPILLPVTDPGQSTLSIARSAVTTVQLSSGQLVDVLVDLLLDDRRGALVAAGTIDVGDGSQSSVARADSVKVTVDVAVDLDFTIPPTGVEFAANTTQDGIDVADEDADQVVDLVDTAVVAAEVVNRTPFAVEVDLAFVGDLQKTLDTTVVDLDTVDVFTQPGAVVLSTIAVGPPTVNAQGQVTIPDTSSVAIALTGTQLRQLLGERFTTRARVRLLPGTGAGGRGGIRAADEVILDASVRLVMRTRSSP